MLSTFHTFSNPLNDLEKQALLFPILILLMGKPKRLNDLSNFTQKNNGGIEV